MEVFVGVQVKVKVSDENVRYCDTHSTMKSCGCNWFDNGVCILFNDHPQVDEDRPGYKRGDPSEWRFIRCKECLKKLPAEDLG